MKMVLGPVVLALSVAALSRADVLENEYVKVTVDSAKGGAVTSMICKKAVVLPFTADKGAQVAGTGAFCVPLVKVGEIVVDLSATPLKGELKTDAKTGQMTLTLNGTLEPVGPGVSIERVISMGKEESGFRVSDTLKNDGAGAKDMQVGMGARLWQQPEPWRISARYWVGDVARRPWLFTPYQAGHTEKLDIKNAQIFWLGIGHYGTGFLYQTKALATPVQGTHIFDKQPGNPAELRWTGAPAALAAGKTLTLSSAVLISEGGREANTSPSLVTSDRVLVTVDMRSGGGSGVAMPVVGTAVSATPRKVKMVASQYAHAGGQPQPAKVIGEADLQLAPGIAAIARFEAKPEKEGLLYVTLTLKDEQGKDLASTNNRAVIDGQKATGEFEGVWKRWSYKLPEVKAAGTWEEIGAQLAKSGALPPEMKGKPSPEAAAFYAKSFPYFAEMLKGAQSVPAPQAAPKSELPAAPNESGVACMGIFFNGPDGPINAYSKERGNRSQSGLGYCKITPKTGYAYHMYTLGGWWFGYGVNTAGLATSGATINCDTATEKEGRRITAEWKKAGKQVAPIGVHVMLATCRNVDDAIAFIENKEAPFEFEGNMMLVDRDGNAAILESVGILHQIIRYDPKQQKGIFGSGNYSHERADGLFKIGPNAGYAENTMLREDYLTRKLTPQGMQASLKDVFTLMESHDLPGGMCQHGFENPGDLVSNTSCIIVTRTGEIFATAGSPCETEYVRYTLDGK
jgi:hypothetical protein